MMALLFDEDYDRESAAAKEVADLRKRIEMLLAIVGDKGRCRGCGAEIWWVKTRRGKPAPYDTDGLSHFATCPQAKTFRKHGGLT